MPIWSAVRASCARDWTRRRFCEPRRRRRIQIRGRENKGRRSLTFGEVLVTARHTPGHTPEHIFVFAGRNVDLPDEPWGILTGDSLFVSSPAVPIC